MRLIEIDVVGFEPPQGIFDRSHHIVRREADLAVAHVHTELGRQYDLVTTSTAFEPFAHNGLRLTTLVAIVPTRVNVRRVVKVKPGIEPTVEQTKRHFFIRRPSEDIAAKTNW